MLDRGLAFEIFELDAQTLLAGELLFGITADIAFALKHIEHMGTKLRRRRQDRVLARLLAVADAGEHITQRIGHRHQLSPYQLDLVRPGIRPLLPSSRSMMRDRRNLR